MKERINFILPRYRLFKDWYKLMWPLNRSQKDENVLHLRNGLKFHVREITSSDVNVIIDIFLKEEYKIKDLFRRDYAPIVFDFGANIGVFSEYVKFIYPNAKIAAFEPDFYNFELLCKNTNVFRDNEAVGAENGLMTLFQNDSYSGSTLVRGNVNPNFKNPKTKVVKVVALKQILNVTERVDLMKMDIEGSEYDAILNTPKELLRKVRHLFVEIHSSHTDKTPHDLIEYIESCGFSLESKNIEMYYFKRI